MRKAKIERKTKETQITLDLKIEGSGKYNIENPIGFLTHVLENFAKHGLFDIKMKAKGDLEVDQHHLVEDC
ncbi:MAG: imidazoleglycerol-phosphate dehydratase, partial [candidate division WOR-3 bacterium]